LHPLVVVEHIDPGGTPGAQASFHAGHMGISLDPFDLAVLGQHPDRASDRAHETETEHFFIHGTLQKKFGEKNLSAQLYQKKDERPHVPFRAFSNIRTISKDILQLKESTRALDLISMISDRSFETSPRAGSAGIRLLPGNRYIFIALNYFSCSKISR
jgi:hypothetical protein